MSEAKRKADATALPRVPTKREGGVHRADRGKEVRTMAKEGETYACETCGLTVRVTKSDKKGVNIPYC